MAYKLFINGVETDKHSNKIVSSVEINNTTYSVARYEYSITTSVTNGNKTGSTSILVGGTATVTITADSGYELPSSVTVVGASYSYNNGVISLSNPTSDVTISAVCEAVASGYTVTVNKGNVYMTYECIINGEWNGPYQNSVVFENVRTFNVYANASGNRLRNSTGSITNTSWDAGKAYNEDIVITQDSSTTIDIDD